MAIRGLRGRKSRIPSNSARVSALARSTRHRQTGHMAEQPPTDDPDVRRISVTVDGNRLEALETGRERLQAILDLIDGAKDSLRLIFYIFAGDEAGTAVRDALVRAARRGVVVRLLLDGLRKLRDGLRSSSSRSRRRRAALLHVPAELRPAVPASAITRSSSSPTSGGRSSAAPISRTATSATRATNTGATCGVLIEGPAAVPASRYFDSLFRVDANQGREAAERCGGSSCGTASRKGRCNGSSAGRSAARTGSRRRLPAS